VIPDGNDFGPSPCPTGMKLLKMFKDKYRGSFGFISPQDLDNPDSDSFLGSPEWRAFAEHVILCPRCNEV